MKMKHYLYVACMFIAALAFTACSDDDDNSVKLANVTLHFNAPSELQSYNPTIGIQELTLKQYRRNNFRCETRHPCNYIQCQYHGKCTRGLIYHQYGRFPKL